MRSNFDPIFDLSFDVAQGIVDEMRANNSLQFDDISELVTGKVERMPQVKAWSPLKRQNFEQIVEDTVSDLLAEDTEPRLVDIARSIRR